MASDCFFGRNGQIQIFEPLHAVAALDLAAELVGEFVLRFDRTENGLLALVELPNPCHAIADVGDLLFVQSAGLIASIARDEGHRIATIQQRDRSRDGIGGNFNFARGVGNQSLSRLA